MLEAYSNIGRTYVVNALFNVAGSLEMKHLCIRLALGCALATVLLMCVIHFKLSSPWHTKVFDSVDTLHYMITNVYSSQCIILA